MAYGQNEGDKATLSALNYGMHFFLGESKRESMEVPCVVRWYYWTTERGAKKDPFHAANQFVLHKKGGVLLHTKNVTI